MPATKLASEAGQEKTRARAGWGVAGGGEVVFFRVPLAPDFLRYPQMKSFLTG